jgi:DNA polymerase I-like protein with 3'-5' exonuclease and polymerase domains
MMHEINANSEQSITRDESKLFLLKSINSMDFTSEALADVYPGLGRWIRQIRNQLQIEDGYVETILKRKFLLCNAKNILAALNAAMQGSVAHAMQAVIRRIWEQFGARLITEIHDSLVISCPAQFKYVEQIMDDVANIMLRPFVDIMGDNSPVFPVNVSIGKKWKTWKLCRIYRENGVYRVKKITPKN